MPISDRQERWDTYCEAGTKTKVRAELYEGESLSEFLRVAIDAELARRKPSRRRKGVRV